MLPQNMPRQLPFTSLQIHISNVIIPSFDIFEFDVIGSSPDEVNGFFPTDVILSAAQRP
jgi:hypothetical protein